jgi:hypothetical protein
LAVEPAPFDKLRELLCSLSLSKVVLYVDTFTIIHIIKLLDEAKDTVQIFMELFKMDKLVALNLESSVDRFQS